MAVRYRNSTRSSILGPSWVHFGSILGSIFDSGSSLGPFWVHFGSIFDSGSILGPFWVHFGSIFEGSIFGLMSTYMCAWLPATADFQKFLKQTLGGQDIRCL